MLRSCSRTGLRKSERHARLFYANRRQRFGRVLEQAGLRARTRRHDAGPSMLFDECIRAGPACAASLAVTGNRVDDKPMVRFKIFLEDEATIELIAMLTFQKRSGKRDTAPGIAALLFSNSPIPSNTLASGRA